ncbi:tetratricopeptide repeat protein [bacterium]|nr:tetratricopeptide repeat protein [bacterium]
MPKIFYVIILILLFTKFASAQEHASNTADSPQKLSEQETMISKLAGLQENLEKNPSSPVLNYELAKTYLELGEVDNALKSLLDCVVNIEPDNEAATQLEDFTDENRQNYDRAIKMMKTHNDFESRQLFSGLLQKYPNSPEIYFNMAILDGNAAYYFDFIENIYAGAKLSTSAKEFFRILGGLYILVGDNSNAEKMFAKALELDPSYAPIYVWLGKLRLMEKNYDEGMYALRKAIKIDPDDYSAKVTLGRIYMEMRKFDQAEPLLQSAVELNKTYWEAYRALGFLYYYKNDIEKSIQMFKEVIVLQPNKIEPLLDLAKIYQSQGRFKEAISQMQSALRLMPDKPMLYCDLADLYAADNDLQIAIDNFNTALDINNNMPLVHYRLGLLYYKQQKFEKAVQEFKKTIQQKSDFVDAYKSLYIIYKEELHNPQEAEYYLKMQQLMAN